MSQHEFTIIFNSIPLSFDLNKLTNFTISHCLRITFKIQQSMSLPYSERVGNVIYN